MDRMWDAWFERNVIGKARRMTTNGDGRLVSAFLILATGVGAVMLVEQLHSQPSAPGTDYRQRLLPAALAASLPGVIDRAVAAAESASRESASRTDAPAHATAFRTLADGDLCR